VSKPLRWGIIGTGGIAKKFATGLQSAPDAELVAVGSRSQESADKFANEFNIPTRHASYEALATDSNVDAVYIGTPHPYHKGNTLLCLQNYKNVLVEKPFTVNAQEAQEVIKFAREQGVFLMEAMWTRFFPAMVKLRDLIAGGAIGEVMLVQADFGFRMGTVRPEHRLFSPDFAGGALLDVGIYPISLASMIFGKQPTRIASMTNLGETGVDELSAVIFGYKHNRMAIASTAIQVNTPHEARISGTEGQIYMPDFWHPSELTLYRNGQPPQTFDLPFVGNGYNYEANEVAKCLSEGKLESDIMPLDESLGLMQTLDKIRAEWGLKYPME
jgi:predicted dehydrogenase